MRRGATLGMFHTVVEEMVAGKVRVALSSRVLALAPGAPSLPGQGARRADRINSARSGILAGECLHIGTVLKYKCGVWTALLS